MVEAGDGLSGAISRIPDARSGDVLHPRVDGNGICRYYVVRSILTSSGSAEIWVVVKGLRKDDDCISCAGSRAETLCMNEKVRRVALVHRCTDDFRVDLQKGRIVHSRSASRGGAYDVVGKSMGFPPVLGRRGYEGGRGGSDRLRN